MTENFIDILNKLGDSPMFNMSLGSKELFHTNMLNWLAKRYPDDFVELIIDIVGTKCTWIGKFHKIFPQKIELPQDGDFEYYIKREKKKFDFSIWEKSYTKNKKGIIKYKDYPVFILENKVKSIPAKDQLDEYVNKAEKIYGKDLGKDKVFYVLLSLSTPSIDIIKDGKWNILNYVNENPQKSYHNLLKKHFLNKKENIDNVNDDILQQFSYNEQLINDYCGYIENMHSLVKIWEAEFKRNNPYRYNYKSEEFKAYENIRIHDLYEKIKMSEIAKKLRVEIGIASVNITTGYSNEQGILDCDLFTYNKDISSTEKDKKSWIAIRIEIQGNRYKRCIVFNGGQFAKKSWDSIIKCNIVRDFLYFKDSPDIMKCKKHEDYLIDSKRHKGKVPYNSYGNNFMYIDANLNSDITINVLIEQIIKDYKQVNSPTDKTSLTKLFKEITNNNI